jgi:hypothetical protein
MLTVARRYSRRDRRSREGLGASPREVDRLNAVELAALGEATRDQILADLDAETAALVGGFAAATDLHQRFPFHGGVEIDFAAGVGNLLAELCIHGRDVAVAAARPWRIEERDAVLILNGVMQIIPAYAVRSARTSLRLRLAVPGAEPWVLDFADGALESRAATPGEPCDVVLRCPAETLVLTLYARLSPPRALLHGMRLRGGRRPWRIARLPRLLQKP